MRSAKPCCISTMILCSRHRLRSRSATMTDPPRRVDRCPATEIIRLIPPTKQPYHARILRLRRRVKFSRKYGPGTQLRGLAVPQAQSEKRELRAVPGRVPARTIRTHPPCEASGQAFRGRRHDLVRKPDAGNPHVRFDERRRGNAAMARIEAQAKRRKPQETAALLASAAGRATLRLYNNMK